MTTPPKAPLKGKLKLAVLVLATVLVGAGIAYTEYATSPAEVVLEVDGMVCEGCASHVQEELVRVPGVKSAAVTPPSDNAPGMAKVYVDRAAPPERERLIEAVVKAGYKAK